MHRQTRVTPIPKQLSPTMSRNPGIREGSHGTTHRENEKIGEALNDEIRVRLERPLCRVSDVP